MAQNGMPRSAIRYAGTHGVLPGHKVKGSINRSIPRDMQSSLQRSQRVQQQKLQEQDVQPMKIVQPRKSLVNQQIQQSRKTVDQEDGWEVDPDEDVIPQNGHTRAAHFIEYEDDQYDHQYPQQRPSQAKTRTYPQQQPHYRKRSGWRRPLLVLLFLGFCVIAILFLAAQTVVWFKGVQDDQTYTKDFRTYSADAAIFQGDTQTPSHFIIQNIHGAIVLYVLPHMDVLHPQSYIVVHGATTEDERIPATLSFKDENGDHLLDIVVTVGQNEFVLYNTGSGLSRNDPTTKG